MTNRKNNVNSKNEFSFGVLCFRNDTYFFCLLKGSIKHNDVNSIDISDSCNGIISFKFSNFAQQVNVIAQSRNIEYIAMSLPGAY